MIKINTICDVFTICSTYLIHNGKEGYIIDSKKKDTPQSQPKWDREEQVLLVVE